MYKRQNFYYPAVAAKDGRNPYDYEDSKAHYPIDRPLPLYTPINADNRRYLTAKLKRAGHRLDHLVAALSETGKAESDRP